MTTCEMFNQICSNCGSRDFSYSDIEQIDSSHSVVERVAACNKCESEYTMISNIEWMIVMETLT